MDFISTPIFTRIFDNTTVNIEKDDPSIYSNIKHNGYTLFAIWKMYLLNQLK